MTAHTHTHTHTHIHITYIYSSIYSYYDFSLEHKLLFSTAIGNSYWDKYNHFKIRQQEIMKNCTIDGV